MEQRLTPGVFYGSAIAALVGLLFGLMLHAAWQNNPGGPRILFSRAEAAETHPDPGDAGAAADQAELDASHVAPDPLPVTRLAPQMFEVQPAAEDEQREAVDDAVADDTPQDAPRDLD